jgi:hypothetical protein
MGIISGRFMDYETDIKKNIETEITEDRYWKWLVLIPLNDLFKLFSCHAKFISD